MITVVDFTVDYARLRVCVVVALCVYVADFVVRGLPRAGILILFRYVGYVARTHVDCCVYVCLITRFHVCPTFCYADCRCIDYGALRLHDAFC